LTDGSLVGLAAVQAAGMSAESLRGDAPIHERAAAALAGQDLLLILDNCEHLLTDVVEFVDRLLGVSNGPVVMATSREALGIDGERQYRVSPLAVTNGDQPPPAVELFAQRAAAVGRSIDLTDPAVASICHKLDGVPLSIELAASKMILMRPDELDARLGAQLTELTSRHRRGRHHSLEAVLEWSWNLLEEPVAQLFVQLGVFSGGWTLQAAEAVCDEPQSVAPRLQALVDSSLVEVNGDTTPTRFRMLEPVRQFAVSRLDGNPRSDVLRGRHLTWWLDHTSARPIGEQWLSGRWAREILNDFDNLRMAITWALATERADDAAALISASIAAWYDGPRAAEMDILFDAVTAACRRPPARFWLAGAVNDMSLARHVRLADRVRTAMRQSIDDEDIACESFASSLVAYSTATIDATAALAVGDAALGAARRLSDPDILVLALAFTAATKFIAGDVADALVRLREAASYQLSDLSLASGNLHLVEFFVALDVPEAGDPTTIVEDLIAGSPAGGMHQQVGMMCRAFDHARQGDGPAVEQAVNDAYELANSTGYVMNISDAAVAAAELLESSGRTIPASTIIAALHRQAHSQPEIYHRYRRARQRLPPTPTPDRPYSTHQLHQIVLRQLATLHSEQ
jgi:predicted ATPase